LNNPVLSIIAPLSFFLNSEANAPNPLPYPNIPGFFFLIAEFAILPHYFTILSL
jgi:hypothetical protein